MYLCIVHGLTGLTATHLNGRVVEVMHGDISKDIVWVRLAPNDPKEYWKQLHSENISELTILQCKRRGIIVMRSRDWLHRLTGYVSLVFTPHSIHDALCGACIVADIIYNNLSENGHEDEITSLCLSQLQHICRNLAVMVWHMRWRHKFRLSVPFMKISTLRTACAAFARNLNRIVSHVAEDVLVATCTLTEIVELAAEALGTQFVVRNITGDDYHIYASEVDGRFLLQGRHGSEFSRWQAHHPELPAEAIQPIDIPPHHSLYAGAWGKSKSPLHETHIGPAEAAQIAEACRLSHLEHNAASARDRHEAAFADYVPAIVLLTFGRNPKGLETAILQSPLAREMVQQRLDIQPGWANGAKVLQHGIVPEMLDAESLRPYHVIIAENKEQLLMESLQHLPYSVRKLRPGGRAHLPGIFSTFGLSDSSELFLDGVIQYDVLNTFIHYRDVQDVRSVRTV